MFKNFHDEEPNKKRKTQISDLNVTVKPTSKFYKQMEASNDNNFPLEQKSLQLIWNKLHNLLYILPYMYLKHKTKQKQKRTKI